jgi:hypothetical protein
MAWCSVKKAQGQLDLYLTLSCGYEIGIFLYINVILFSCYVKPEGDWIRKMPFEKFVDWQQCSVVMQKTAVIFIPITVVRV